MTDRPPDAPTPEAKQLVAELKKWGLRGLTDDTFAQLLDAFTKNAVARERERCFRWATRFVPREEAGRAIRDGDPIGGEQP